MPYQNSAIKRLLARPSTPAVIVMLFVLAMSGCVVGLVAWKAADARASALAQRATAIQNLAHSLAEQASHAIQSVDVALSALVDTLARDPPNAERFNRRLLDLIAILPQIRDFAIIDGNGACRTSAPLVCAANAEPDSFSHFRDHDDSTLLISGSLQRGAARPTVTLSRRLIGPDGDFSGVIVATINTDLFRELYNTFRLGPAGGITVLRADGMVLIQSPSMQTGDDPAKRDLAPEPLPGPLTGFQKVVSRGGVARYFGYARAPHYPFVIAVAQQEDDILADWRTGLRSDITVAALLLCSVTLLAALLSSQFRLRLEIEKRLRQRKDELDALNSRLAELATTDGLTGLANRRSLDGFLRLEFAAQSDIAVLLFDIDNFKGFNDRLGHQAGDDCLKRVAAVLAAATADRVGLSARYGGEEFVIILPGLAEADALRIAEAVRCEVAALGIANEASDRGYLTVSIGVAGKTADVANEQELLRNADLALYAAKRCGRNRSVACSSLMEPAVSIVPHDPPFAAAHATDAPALAKIVGHSA